MFELHKHQLEINGNRSRYRVLCCGRRFGKTVLAVQEMIANAINCKGGRQIAYVAPTYQQARDIAWNMLKKMAGGSVNKINEARLEITLDTFNHEEGKLISNGGTSILFLKGWEAIESLRGMYFDFVVIDEVASMRNFWESWEEVIAPTLTDRKGRVLFTSTPKGFNHFYDLYTLEKDAVKGTDFKSFHFTSYDNPFLPKDEIDKFKKRLPEDRFAQEYMADFRKKEDLVYPEFNRIKHIYNPADIELPEFKSRIAGIDFGYNSPAAIEIIRIDKDNNFWITDEWYKRGQTGAQIAEMAAWYKPNIVYPDPAEPDKVQDLRNVGLNVRESNKNVDHGIDRVRELFKQDRIKISSACKNLILELETYSYPEHKPGRNEKEIPIKDNDHCVDALRYAIYTHSPGVDFGFKFKTLNKTYV